MDKIKLAIAGDKEKFRKAIVAQISQEDDVEIILQVENCRMLVEKLRRISPSIILMNVGMPEMDGVEATAEIRKQYPQIRIIVFLQYCIDSDIIEMNIQGVKGFLTQDDDSAEFLKAIRIVHDGGVYMPNRVAAILQRYLSEAFSRLTEENRFYSIMISQLSKTELKVLWLSSQHKSVKKIAEALFVSPNTVNNHLANVRRKLNLNGRGALLQYALSIKNRLVKMVENL
jgi:DNA-binding NarL/FixJ family response regulator